MLVWELIEELKKQNQNDTIFGLCEDVDEGLFYEIISVGTDDEGVLINITSEF